MKNLHLFILAFVIITGCKKELVDTAANDIRDLNSLASLNSEIETGVSLVFYHPRPFVDQVSTTAVF